MLKSNDKIEKVYYKIGEVSKICDLHSSNIRFWLDSGLDKLVSKTSRNKQNQRLFKKVDIELIKKMKSLRFDSQYTVKGAIDVLTSTSVFTPKDKKNKCYLCLNRGWVFHQMTGEKTPCDCTKEQ